jgi:polyisoprenoid-binding protein YceI
MSTGTETVQAIPAGTYAVDPLHSSVGFAVVHNGVATFRSGFSAYEARLTGGEEPQLEGSVEVASIEVPDEQLKGHLLSPEFFDAERHPSLRFESSELEVGENGAVRVRGILEIGGRRQEVEASGRFAEIDADLGGSARVGLSLAIGVDRRDYGLDWQAELPSGGEVLDWAVEIVVELELVEEGE